MFTPYSTVVAGDPILASDWNNQVHGNGTHLFTSSGFAKRSIGGLQGSIAGVTKGSALFAQGSSDWAARTLFTASLSGVLKHEYGGLELNVSAITNGDIFTSTAAGKTKILNAGSTGDHIEVQPDGSLGYAGGIKFARKATDESIANTAVLQNDDDLKITGASSEVYHVVVAGLFNSTNNADFKIAWSLPTGSSFSGVVSYPLTTAGGAASTPVRLTTGQTEAIGGNAGNGVTGAFNFVGSIHFGNAGTANLQWAQNTQHDSTTTMLAGSHIFAVKGAG